MSQLCMNIKQRAVTNFSGFDFTSAVQAQGLVLLAGPDGLYSVGGATDDGSKIDASFATGEMNVNDGKKSRVRAVVAGGETSGDMGVEINYTDGTAYTEPLDQTSMMANGRRTGVGKYLKMTFSNKNGESFLIDSINAVIVPQRF